LKSGLAGDAGVRHADNDPLSCEPPAAPKTPAANDTEAEPVRIDWSTQEIRRIATRLAQRRIEPAHVIAWSLWRQAHQAAAKRSHLKQRMQL
jgi:hypothetical protein